jgi:peptidoglycan/LPS O-acetylase OafA/YrhL
MDRMSVEAAEINPVQTAAPGNAVPGPVRAGSTHIPALDGIRGLAILMVMVFHFYDSSPTPSHSLNAFNHIVQFGQTGVDLFFVLSGFLITGILLDAKHTAHYFRNFYARRVLRIFPLYYGALIVVFVLGHHSADYIPQLPRGANQLLYWMYASNFWDANARGLGHFWSLAIEEQFYLIWPAVVWFSSERRLKQICIATFFGAFVSRWYVARHFPGAEFYWTFCRVDALAVGALIAALARSDRGLYLLRKYSLPVVVVAVLLTAMAWLVIPKGTGGWGVIVKHSLLALIFGAAVSLAGAAKEPAVFVHVFSARWLRLLGKYSYGMYVYHGMIIDALKHFAPADWFGARLQSHFLGNVSHAILGMAVTFVLAFISWHVFEKQFLKLKRYFEYRQASQ